MMLSPFFLIGWFGCIILCYFLIRPITNKLIRIILTFLPCILLTYITCRDLPEYDVFSLLIIVLCWMTSIRLVHLTIFSIDQCLTFQSFLFKTLWILFPVLPLKSKRNEWPIRYYLISIVIKLLLNQWIYRWSMCSETRDSYARILMVYGSMGTISYLLDTEVILVRILTRNQYTLESYTDFPIFSLSLREFWGQRYNRFVSTVFKESIFEPIRSEFSSSTIGGLTTFLVSGLLHVHVASIVFGMSSILPTFMFFFVHGIICSLEANVNIPFSKPVRWLLTTTFLLLTSPVILGPFIKKGSPFLIRHPSPFIDIEWIPKLPVPSFCPR